MLKVVHFIPSVQMGGAERQVACIVQNCSDFEHYLVALYLDQDNYLKDTNRLKIISSRKILDRLSEFNAITRSVKPDVIFAWGVLPYLLAIFASLGGKSKVINGSIRHGVFKRSLGGYLRKFLLKISKYIVANSRAGLRANGLKKGLLLYNGIEERFNKARFQSSVGTGLPSDKIVLVSVANLVPYKDYPTVFEALRKLKQEGMDFLYHVIGDGPLGQTYKDMVISMGIGENVLFHGRVPNPEDYLAQADIFIHSSKGEGCSNAILEAMYMGLPIIATDTGGTGEIVGSNAMLFAYQDTSGLHRALSTIIKDKELRLRMGEESYRIACRRFTISRMVSDYGRIIRAVVNENLAEVSDLKYSS